MVGQYYEYTLLGEVSPRVFNWENQLSSYKEVKSPESEEPPKDKSTSLERNTKSAMSTSTASTTNEPPPAEGR